MRILLTGFEPFGGLQRNPSGDLARALDGARVAGATITGAVLPVDYAQVGPALDRLLAADAWGAVVLTGVAVGRAQLSLERVAINHREVGRSDNSGKVPESPALVPGGPAAYFSTLPLEALRDELLAAGLPVEISLSAGAYLCNAAFYLARHATDPRATPCGFVHLPPTPDLALAAAPLPFEEQRRGLERMFARLAESGQDIVP
jgi:pyroglutamyl-peptidase